MDKQDRRFTCNVILERVPVTTFAVEKKAKSITYSQCVSVVYLNACAVSYCNLWPVRLYHVFPRYIINGRFFFGGGEVIEHKMCVLIFYTTFA